MYSVSQYYLRWLVFSIALIIIVARIDAPYVDMASPFAFCMFLLMISLPIIFWHTNKVQITEPKRAATIPSAP